MTDLTLMTFASDPATVLPSLALLSHRVRVLPMDAASLVKMPENTILFLDARDDLATAKTLCRLIHASGLSTPIVLVLTEGGAKCLGYKDVGKLETGYKADITLVDREGLHWYPKNDTLSLMAYSANSMDVDTVLVNGKVLLRNKEFTTIDIEKVKSEAERTKIKLFASL